MVVKYKYLICDKPKCVQARQRAPDKNIREYLSRVLRKQKIK